MQKSLTPAEHYSRDLAQGKILPDRAQEEAIRELDLLYQHLVNHWQRPRGFLQSLFGRGQAPNDLKGLYLWGGVGRGKTYLMDIFFHCLPGERKLRMHFHRFMQTVHRSLYANRGRKNPLQRVAAEISEKADVICFDEFYVSDIGDAMILGNLLEALFANSMVLVATSNIIPEKLYERGLQRQKFLPAIALLEQYTQVMNVDGGTDYRLRTLENAGIYHTPLGEQADAAMQTCFNNLARLSHQPPAATAPGYALRDVHSIGVLNVPSSTPARSSVANPAVAAPWNALATDAGEKSGLARGMVTTGHQVLEILGRDITTRNWAEGIAWFEFDAICDGPRSAADYIEISQLCHTVLVSGVPVFDETRDDQARRFIAMVDEFYDQNVKLILSAAMPLESLYQGSDLAFPFERTRSRLLEMQSLEYLAQEHHPDT